MANPYFSLLQELEKKSVEVAVGLPTKQVQQEQWSGIGFKLLSIPLIIPMDQVIEVMILPEFRKVFGVQTWVLGIANVRGILLPIFDVQSFLLNKNSDLLSKNWRILMVTYKDYQLGLLVDGPLELKNFDVTSYINNPPPKLPNELTPFVTGCFKKGERYWGVFDLNILVDHPEFSKVSLND